MRPDKTNMDNKMAQDEKNKTFYDYILYLAIPTQLALLVYFFFVIQNIIGSSLPREEIFILARTNRQLSELSNKLKVSNIRHIVKSDEINRSVIAKQGEITLATIHAIKGLEAEMVFVLGCTSMNLGIVVTSSRLDGGYLLSASRWKM